MTTSQLLYSAWDWKQPAVYICVVLVGYVIAAHPRTLRENISLTTAIILTLLALASPIAVIGETYLFSAHMLQHFILVMLVPPLLLASVPENVVPRPQTAMLKPVLCWLVGVSAMLLWHLPAFADFSMRHGGFHAIEQFLFVLTALAFWWPVFGPVRSARLHPVITVAYLSTACICCTALGVAITFARAQLYPAYLHPTDAIGALPLIRNEWGISPRVDQQLGGLLMWVPGCLVYLSAMLVRILGWFAENDAAALPQAAHVR